MAELEHAMTLLPSPFPTLVVFGIVTFTSGLKEVDLSVFFFFFYTLELHHQMSVFGNHYSFSEKCKASSLNCRLYNYRITGLWLKVQYEDGRGWFTGNASSCSLINILKVLLVRTFNSCPDVMLN